MRECKRRLCLHHTIHKSGDQLASHQHLKHSVRYIVPHLLKRQLKVYTMLSYS